MKFKLIAGVAAVVAALAATSAAEAGGGKRLGFGFPLGSFTATPAHGGAHQAPRKSRKGAVEQAARKGDKKTTPRLAKATPQKSSGVAASEPVTETQSADEGPRVTGSSALVQQSVSSQEDKAGQTDADEKSEVAVSGSDNGSSSCTRFVPAIGTTVAVECDR